MKKAIPRRALLGLGPLALAGCGRRERYFGKATPPSTQTLIYEIGSEPSGMDPATSFAISEFYIWPALFEGLLSRHPETLEPEAGLATHYHVNASQMEFTFFLRGHPSPAGIQLRGPDSARTPALWSDGRPVTADDFVYAWRRVVDPASGGVYQNVLYPVAGAKEIAEGKLPLEMLGVRALDSFTFRVSLKGPAAHFLKVASIDALAAVPCHAIQEHGASWTTPGRMVSCGPFLLHEWKPYERIVVRKNPRYYDAARVALEEIVFLPVTDGATSVNLYKTGSAYAMHGRAVPPLWIPALRGRQDFQVAPAYRNLFYAFNTTQPPFDNILLRYAFHMATDKQQITRFLAGGQTPARTVIPPFGGYQGVESLPIDVGGRVWDVLSYDPDAARALMKIAGVGQLVFDLTFPNRPRSKEMAQILQSQWRTNLGAEVKLAVLEWNIWVQTLSSLAYRGMTECGWGADYADPNTFFENFDGRIDGSGWTDPEYRRLVDQANAEADHIIRMRKLAKCEEYLLRAMPVLPIFFDSHSYLQKPYVRGLTPNILDVPQFKSVWIDTNWRQS